MTTKTSTFRLPRELRDAFVAATHVAGETASAVLKRYMREYLSKQKRKAKRQTGSSTGN